MELGCVIVVYFDQISGEWEWKEKVKSSLIELLLLFKKTCYRKFYEYFLLYDK